MDVLVPMASQPTEMAARNWMLRRMMLETIRNDPDYNGGNYTSQPRMMKYAVNAFGIATSGGTLAYQMLAPTAAKADKMFDDRMAIADHRRCQRLPLSVRGLARLQSVRPAGARSRRRVLAINAADDERNPPETGVTEAAMKRIRNARLYPDPGLDRDPRPPHHRQCQVLHAAIAGIAADRAAKGDVRPAARSVLAMR